jgi:streptomycin 3"-adenylyltransferase
LDVLAIIDRPTTHEDRRRLIEALMPLSGPPVAGTARRPVELTVVNQSDVKPWRYPPRMEFQYGEWLKGDYEAGFVPGPAENPDLAPLLSIVVMGNRPLFGPPPAEVIDPVPASDLRAAVVAGVPDLVAELEPDTRNVLLTLARIWHTTATGQITPKDAAAEWAAARLEEPERNVILTARDQYLAGTHGDWSETMASAKLAAEAMRRAVV